MKQIKTPEQMAEEYCEDHDECEFARDAFLAGYQAAMNSPEKQDSCEHILDMEKMVDVNSFNGWISVKERLPQESTHCVIRIDDGEYQVAWREDGHWIMFNPCCIYNFQLNNVTHWMPLPNPPEDI